MTTASKGKAKVRNAKLTDKQRKNSRTLTLSMTTDSNGLAVVKAELDKQRENNASETQGETQVNSSVY